MERHDSRKTKSNVQNPGSVGCQYCNRKFSSACVMYRHMRLVHKVEPKMKYSNSAKCPLCGKPLQNIRAVDEHLKTIHNITIEVEKLQFSSQEDFDCWKYEMESRTTSYYIKMTDKINRFFYTCHHSGKSRKQDSYVRAPLKQSSKMGSSCPARISGYITEKGVEVLWHKTHVGHKTPLEFLSLPQEQDHLASFSITDTDIKNMLSINAWNNLNIVYDLVNHMSFDGLELFVKRTEELLDYSKTIVSKEAFEEVMQKPVISQYDLGVSASPSNNISPQHSPCSHDSSKPTLSQQLTPNESATERTAETDIPYEIDDQPLTASKQMNSELQDVTEVVLEEPGTSNMSESECSTPPVKKICVNCFHSERKSRKLIKPSVNQNANKETSGIYEGTMEMIIGD